MRHGVVHLEPGCRARIELVSQSAGVIWVGTVLNIHDRAVTRRTNGGHAISTLCVREIIESPRGEYSTADILVRESFRESCESTCKFVEFNVDIPGMIGGGSYVNLICG